MAESTLSRVRRKLDKYEWARKIAAQLDRDGNKFVSTKLELPVGPGEHDQEYYCSDCGAFLYLDPSRPHEHKCVFCGKIFRGAQYDSVWQNRIHTMVSVDARRASYAYLLSPSPELFRALRDYLIFYTKRYKSGFPEQGPEYSRGKVTTTGLTEAMWVLNLLWVYHSIEEGLSPEERNSLRDELFVPVALLLAPQATIIHNIHTWYMSAVGAIGATFGDEALLQTALNGPSGLHAQISEGFYRDGLWYEGAPTYHFFTLYAMLQLIYFAGIDVKTSIPRFSSLFLAPWKIVQPNLVLPALNDCYYGMEPSQWQVISDPDGGWLLSRFAPYYEMAVSLSCDEDLSGVLSALYSGNPANRHSPEALFFGPDELASPAELPLQSIQMEETGYGILRGRDHRGKSIYALLKYGQHGRNHEHFDKMQIILYGNDECVVPDLGTIVYAHSLHRAYYKGSLGHNLIVANEKDQLRAIGQSRYFVPAPFLQLMEAEEDDMTQDAITQNRAVLISDSYIIDFYQIRSPFQNTYDWIHHNKGKLLDSQKFSEGHFFGNQHYDTVFRNRCSFTSTEAWEVRFRTAHGGFRLLMQPDTVPTQVIAAEGPENPASKFIPVIIARRRTSGTVFIALYEFYDQIPVISCFASERLPLDQGWAFSVSTNEFTDRILFSRTYGKNRKQSGGFLVEGKLGVLREYRSGERLLEIVDGQKIELRDPLQVENEKSSFFKMEFVRPTDAVIQLKADGSREILYHQER
ncbi:MAG: heparinase II/III family protein [Bacteroidota bacterium]